VGVSQKGSSPRWLQWWAAGQGSGGSAPTLEGRKARLNRQARWGEEVVRAKASQVLAWARHGPGVRQRHRWESGDGRHGRPVGAGRVAQRERAGKAVRHGGSIAHGLADKGWPQRPGQRVPEAGDARRRCDGALWDVKGKTVQIALL
jgi:hypothetical protein